MFKSIINFIVHSPVYPHWLEYYKYNKANNYLLKIIKGDVLEIGAGDGSKKIELKQKYPKIKKYLATDYSSWDEEFKQIDNKIKKFGNIAGIILGYKPRIKLDAICDALKLPFEPNSFDYHISFEVLEHINNPFKYFSEATRVVKKGGYIYTSVPFFYRIHGGEPLQKMDFFRYAPGFFYNIAKKNNLQLIQIYINTGFGTSLASITNQWVIRRMVESNVLFKIVLFIACPFIFTIMNTIGLILDRFPDKRFPVRLHVLLKKI
jgi:SAM-dependent methyltransferase